MSLAGGQPREVFPREEVPREGLPREGLPLGAPARRGASVRRGPGRGARLRDGWSTATGRGGATTRGA